MKTLFTVVVCPYCQKWHPGDPSRVYCCGENHCERHFAVRVGGRVRFIDPSTHKTYDHPGDETIVYHMTLGEVG